MTLPGCVSSMTKSPLSVRKSPKLTRAFVIASRKLRAGTCTRIVWPSTTIVWSIAVASELNFRMTVAEASKTLPPAKAKSPRRLPATPPSTPPGTVGALISRAPEPFVSEAPTMALPPSSFSRGEAGDLDVRRGDARPARAAEQHRLEDEAAGERHGRAGDADLDVDVQRAEAQVRARRDDERQRALAGLVDELVAVVVDARGVQRLARVEDLVDRDRRRVDRQLEVDVVDAQAVGRVADVEADAAQREAAGHAEAVEQDDAVGLLDAGLVGIAALQHEAAEVDVEVADDDLDDLRAVRPDGLLEEDVDADEEVGEADLDAAAGAQDRLVEVELHRRRARRDRRRRGRARSAHRGRRRRAS